MTNAQERDLMVERIAKARPLSQTQVDAMSRAAALAATNARISLAKLAAASTRMEIIEDKVIKNHFASDYIYNRYKAEKNCGILSEDLTFGTITTQAAFTI